MQKTLKKEKFKSILLVVLFFSTVLLSYYYLQDISLYNIKENVNEHLFSSAFYGNNSPEISEQIYPDSIKINYGDGTYSVLQDNYEEIWNEFTKYYIASSKSEEISIDEITLDLWEETMDMKSVQYNFNYNLPIECFELLDAENYNVNDYFDCFSTIAYSEASKSSIFIFDATTEKYYRIVSEITNDNIIEKIDEMKINKINQYYPINMILGTGNSSMFPFITNIKIPEITMSTNYKNVIESYEKDLAETFFGQSLNFIRKITDDSGTITYMYGMGQKILTIYSNGKFEYQEEPSNQSSNINLKKAFTIAQSFITNHGSWSSYDGKDLNLKLTDIESDYNKNSKNSIYRFYFNENYNNYPIYNENLSQIEIEITGSSVTHYCRNIQIHAPNELTSDNDEMLKNESLSEILSENIHMIDTILQKYEFTENNDSEMKKLDEIIENITQIEVGYYLYKSDEINIYFKPSWVISFSDLKVFFDLYSGEYLGYNN